MKLEPSKFEKLLYEIKPIAWLAVAVLILLTTSWGFFSLAIPLAILYYTAGIVFLRHKFRGSFKNWMATPISGQTNH